MNRPIPSLNECRPAAALHHELALVRELLAGWSVAHLRVHGRAEGGIDTPFAGSLLRGAFGAALARLASPAGGLAEGCGADSPGLYQRLFAVNGTAGAARAPRRGSLAPPFVLDPPPRIAPGPLSFDLKLFGLEPAALSGVLAVLVEMGRAGIGRERIPLPVEAIDSLTPGAAAERLGSPGTLCADRVRPFCAALLLEDGAFPPAASAPAPRRISLILRTPLRRKEAGRLVSSLSFESLMRVALRRLTDLGEGLGQDWPRSWPAILDAARSAAIERDETRWLDWGRYSLRQGRAMRLGGVVGRMDYRDVEPVLVSVLRAALFFHLGKNASFGLGAADLLEAP